jgi:hypothetical protein
MSHHRNLHLNFRKPDSLEGEKKLGLLTLPTVGSSRSIETTADIRAQEF